MDKKHMCLDAGDIPVVEAWHTEREGMEIIMGKK
jgi:hypothetical protein